MIKNDQFTREWITEKSLEIVDRYEPGILTLRGLHYQLVAIGMTNSLRHYKRVVAAMIKARWDKLVSFEAFSDHDRQMIGETEYQETDIDESIDKAKDQITAWMRSYYKNRWERQPYYPEVFIEKKALQGVFQTPCQQWDVSLGACKGYPSLTFLNQAAERFKEAEQLNKIPIIIYFGDYDPSGEDIPRSIQENLKDLGVNTVEIKRVALLERQVIDWDLPPAPAKKTDSRTAKWDGLGQVELDAVEPKMLQELCNNAIEEVFDDQIYNEVMEDEAEERELYRDTLKQYVRTL